METLWQVASLDARRGRGEAGVPIVTGDTKVVDRGKGDGVFINTTGIGLVPDGRRHPAAPRPPRRRGARSAARSPSTASPIMSVREGLEFEPTVASDSAALHGLVEALLEPARRCASTCCATRRAAASRRRSTRSPPGGGRRHRAATRTRSRCARTVRGACEILGLDPLYVANEGKCVAIVAPEVADEALSRLRAHPLRQRTRRSSARSSRTRTGQVRPARRDRRTTRRRHAERRAAAADLLTRVHASQTSRHVKTRVPHARIRTCNRLAGSSTQTHVERLDFTPWSSSRAFSERCNFIAIPFSWGVDGATRPGRHHDARTQRKHRCTPGPVQSGSQETPRALRRLDGRRPLRARLDERDCARSDGRGAGRGGPRRRHLAALPGLHGLQRDAPSHVRAGSRGAHPAPDLARLPRDPDGRIGAPGRGRAARLRWSATSTSTSAWSRARLPCCTATKARTCSSRGGRRTRSSRRSPSTPPPWSRSDRAHRGAASRRRRRTRRRQRARQPFWRSTG